MIYVTKLNGKSFVVNAVHIEQVEETPDTVITLTSGKKFLVKEPADEIIRKVKQFYRETSLLHGIAQLQKDQKDS